MVICLERCADLHMAQLMPLPLTVSCFSRIQIGFSFMVPAHPGSRGKRPLNGCVCVCHGVTLYLRTRWSAQCAVDRHLGEAKSLDAGAGTSHDHIAIRLRRCRTADLDLGARSHLFALVRSAGLVRFFRTEHFAGRRERV